MIRNILIVTFLLLVNIQAGFVRDSALKVVKDTTTCLVWQDDSASKTVKKTWEDAIDYCEDLSFAGFDDWRLPNINELNGIVDRSKYNPAIGSAFSNVATDYYWSSTTDFSDIKYAWVVYFDYGYGYWSVKENETHVRCVRIGQ